MGSPFTAFPALADRLGVDRSHLVHVGAHEGQEVRYYRQARFERITLVEPIPELAARLRAQHSDLTVVECACSDEPGRADLHIMRRTNMSTLAQPGPRDPVVRVVNVEVRRLDDVAPDATVAVIDAQGFEDRVLAAAPEFRGGKPDDAGATPARHWRTTAERGGFDGVSGAVDGVGLDGLCALAACIFDGCGEQTLANALSPLAGPHHEAVDGPRFALVDRLEEAGSGESRKVRARTDLNPALGDVIDVPDEPGWWSSLGYLGKPVSIVPFVAVAAVAPADVEHAVGSEGELSGVVVLVRLLDLEQTGQVLASLAAVTGISLRLEDDAGRGHFKEPPLVLSDAQRLAEDRRIMLEGQLLGEWIETAALSLPSPLSSGAVSQVGLAEPQWSGAPFSAQDTTVAISSRVSERSPLKR